MVLLVVRVRVGESVVAVGNCAVVRWTRDDSLGANRANNMFVVCWWGGGGRRVWFRGFTWLVFVSIEEGIKVF